MKLKDWMAKNNVTCEVLGEGVGVCNSTISRLAQGRLNARSSLLMDVIAYTKGAVTANDLLGVPQKLRVAR